MNSPWLNLLGLARRAGKLAPGDNQVTLALRRRTAALLIVAEDAGPSVYRKYHLWAQDLNVPLVTMGTKAALGSAIGMGPHAVLAIVDDGFGQRILQEMRITSGGIGFDRKGQRQGQGVRISKRTQAGQPAANRPLASSESGQHQKSHEYRGTRGGQNRQGHNGGQAAAGTRTQTGSDSAARRASAKSPTVSRARSASSAGGRPTPVRKRRQSTPRPKR